MTSSGFTCRHRRWFWGRSMAGCRHRGWCCQYRNSIIRHLSPVPGPLLPVPRCPSFWHLQKTVRRLQGLLIHPSCPDCLWWKDTLQLHLLVMKRHPTRRRDNLHGHGSGETPCTSILLGWWTLMQHSHLYKAGGSVKLTLWCFQIISKCWNVEKKSIKHGHFSR